jgi:hypothetical protein
MRIEFNDWGTNVEVLLLDDLGVCDRAYTADHQARFHYPEDRGIPINARQLFQWVEETWAPPIIGGRHSALHPYWVEREGKKG